MHPPPPPRTKGFFSSVFKTRPQLEAQILRLERENLLLRTHNSVGPCPQCTIVHKILRSVLAKHEA